MLSPDYSHFDVLTGQEESYLGFGDVLPEDAIRTRTFEGLIDAAVCRVKENFAVDVADDRNAATTLDKIISEMWAEGWDPESGNVNLFCTDFGLIVTQTLQELVGGNLVFRSETDLNHVSIHWPELGVEVFPFHKVYKRLSAEEGESLEAFVKGVMGLVGQKKQ